MKKSILLLVSVLFMMVACQQKKTPVADTENWLQEIGTLEKQLLETGDATKAAEAASAFVEKCEAFAKAFPSDPQTPDLLFKAADVARGVKQQGKAVQLWGQMWRKHPGHPNAPMALFLQGFTFDSELRDTGMAKHYYGEFLQTFPNDPLAPQVRQLLDVVGTNPDDLIKQFEAQQ